MRKHKFTQEEIEWVKNKYLNTLETTREIASQFNQLFDTSDYKVSQYAISDLMTRRLKIHRGTNRGRFGVGNNSKKHAPIGTIMSEVQYSTKRYVRIKVSKDRNHLKKSSFNAYYEPYHKYVYERAYGKLKDGEFIIFADGNTHNFSLDNLIKVNRKINGSLTKNGVQSKGKITKAYVECKKLEEVIFNREKNNK